MTNHVEETKLAGRSPSMLVKEDQKQRANANSVLHFRLACGRILLVGKFFLWPLCELPDFCLVRDDGPTPSRQSAYFPHECCGSGDCLDRVGRLLAVDALPSTFP